jgi:hypothetical protein
MMRILVVLLLCVASASCAVQRSQIAQEARASMVGMTKEQVGRMPRLHLMPLLRVRTDVHDGLWWNWGSGTGD